MPLQKPIQTNTGHPGEYFEISYFHWNANTKEVSAHLSLYKDQASKLAGNRPMIPIIAKVRCQGAKFDEHFSDAAITASGRNHKDQAYWVAQNDPACVVSDYHSVEKPMLAGAKTV